MNRSGTTFNTTKENKEYIVFLLGVEHNIYSGESFWGLNSSIFRWTFLIHLAYLGQKSLNLILIRPTWKEKPTRIFCWKS